jgi:ATP-dependent Clp protease ATP-binding subunit ClpA
MEKKQYPVLCWKIGQGHICGHLVGYEYNVVATNFKKIKTMLTSQLVKDIQRGEFFGYHQMLSPMLSSIEVKVTPTYREEDGFYPLNHAIPVQVYAVWGEIEQGSYLCIIPLMDRRFFFYDREQLKVLIRHFAQDHLMSMTPEEIHRYLAIGKPWLEEITLNMPDTDYAIERRFRDHNVNKVLAGFAEKYPSTQSGKNKANPLPDVAWERTELVNQITEKVLNEGVNIAVVGEHGVGKTVILLEAIRKIHKLTKGDERDPIHFWKTSAQRMIAGAKYLGEWQQHCEKIADVLRNSRDYLWISDFVELIKAGGSGAEDSLAAFFIPYLRAGELRIIGEITPRQLEVLRVLLPGFFEYFQIVKIDEMPKPIVQRVLEHFRVYATNNLEVEFEKPALEMSYRLLERFVHGESFPGKAIKFLGRCLNRAYLSNQHHITQREIIDLFSELTGMSEIFLRDDLLLDAVEMQKFFSNRIIGQTQVLEQIYRVIKVFKAGLNNPHKPIATLLMAGPTGVGKTATVQALAAYFFGKGQKLDPLIRLDMSEFQHPMQIERLIGSEQGEPGKLIREVRERPFSVLLLDEIEKAHESIFDVLLSVLDEGILYDAYGRRTDFRNTIIAMTSNLGVGSARTVGFGHNNMPNFEASVRSFFRPEFFNRIDSIMSFDALSPESIFDITLKELSEIAKREGLHKRNIRLDFSEKLVAHLAQEGFDPDYGVRPLQRTIERIVIANIARYLSHQPNTQNVHLLMDYDQNGVELRNHPTK